MKTMTLEEFRVACNAQAAYHAKVVVICPMCKTLQTGEDFIRAGAGETFSEVNKYVGYSCIGRFTGKGGPAQEEGKNHGCNWSLGGLFKLHDLEVITEDGTHHPHFELASKEDADRYRASRKQGGES